MTYMDEQGNILKVPKKLIGWLLKGFELPKYKNGLLQKNVVALESFLLDWASKKN